VEITGHSASGPWRGMKGDAWEGGHRMPLIARWPGHVAAGAVSDALVSQTDFLATISALLDLPPVPTDGVDFSAALSGQAWQRPPGAPLVARSSLGVNTMRNGKWKFINSLGSGGFSTPSKEAPAPGAPAVQLYDLAADPSESTNLAATHPEKAAAYQRQLNDLLDSKLAIDPH